MKPNKKITVFWFFEIGWAVVELASVAIMLIVISGNSELTANEASQQVGTLVLVAAVGWICVAGLIYWLINPKLEE